MGNRRFWFFALFLAAAFSPIATSALELRAKSSVIFVPETVTLGDIVDISPKSAGASFAAISAGMVLRNPTVFSPEGIVSRIGREIEGPFAYTGGASILIPQVYFGGEGLPFLTKLLSFLGAHFPEQYESLELVVHGALPPVRDGDPVDFILGGDEESGFVILYRRSGSASYKRVEAEVVPTGLHRGSAKSVSASVVQARIRSGDSIAVLLVSGTIRAELEGSALESGHAPNSIRVRINDTGKEILARITGHREVQLDF